MKRIFFVLVLMMSVVVISAQTTKTTATTTKSTHAVVKVADLQKPITDNVAKDYEGFTIKDASSITANNVVTYHVVVVKGSDTETLVYDKDGMFVKKLAKTTAKHHTTKKK
jgi:hypothetical protein